MLRGHYAPNWIGEPVFVPGPPREYDSTIVPDDEPAWILCSTCNRLRVPKQGDQCQLCRCFLAPSSSPATR